MQYLYNEQKYLIFSAQTLYRMMMLPAYQISSWSRNCVKIQIAYQFVKFISFQVMLE